MEPDPKRFKTTDSYYRPTLQTGPTEKFLGNFPPVRKPHEVGYFYKDERRNFIHGPNKQVKFLFGHVSSVNFDLKKGYSTFVERDKSVKEYIDDLLRWVCENKFKFELPSSKTENIAGTRPFLESLSTDFICWRGLLTKLLCTPYENREGWKLVVTKYKGTCYMCEYDTAEKIANLQTETEKQKLFTYGGHKFEQYMTTDKSGAKPDTSLPVNNSEGFCSVVRSRLAHHSLVYGGEVDCVEGDLSNYVELKTSREIDHPGQLRNFKRFKLIKWWCQSFLLGINKIVCGFRDDNSIVHRLETFHIKEIPKYCEDIHNPWRPTVCFNFLDQFLSFVKNVATKDDPKVGYLFTWRPGEDVEWRETTESEYQFIPDWYCDWWNNVT